MTGLLAALLSLLIPGAGHIAISRRERGVTLLAAALAALAVLLWLDRPAAWLLLVPFWLVVASDAAILAAGGRPHTAWLVVVAALPFYIVGWHATEIAPARLVTGFPRIQRLIPELLSPDIVTREREAIGREIWILTPCPDPLPAAELLTDEAPSLAVFPVCAPLGATLTVKGAGYPAASNVDLTWINPGRAKAPLGTVTVDAAGRFVTQIVVPRESIPERFRDTVQQQRLSGTVYGSPGALRPSHTMLLIMEQLGVTISLGLMATLFGALMAVPLSVVGARNLMGRGLVGRSVYYCARMLMNFVRSVEPLILAVVFVVWVGQGPFAGMLALSLHSMAALGKLYSEQIESIGPGPVEAVRATGAGWLQTVAYAVLPQVVPPFTAFTVYRWDINVRMSTILGFVGGGGIGFLLQQWIQRYQWSEVATAVIVIAAVIMVLDFLSAAVRERITAGRALFRPSLRPVACVTLALLAAWAWRTSEIEPRQMIQEVRHARGFVGQLLRPDLVARDTITETAQAALIVPCGLEDVHLPLETESEMTPQLSIGSSCADPGDSVAVAGVGFRPGGRAFLRWLLPGGGRLSARSAGVGDDGALETEVEVRPLLAQRGREASAPIQLEARATQEVGPPRPSPTVDTTVDKLILTIMMALIATTLGAILALPVSLMAARNLMPPNAVGNAAYYASRTLLNVQRSIEPIILASLFAVWVGFGSPFAGILALTIVTLANLGKLFSEAVENIDPGPLEAVRATGANGLQVIVYGVIPQIIPPFLSFGIYQWDINVRISTVIGFVGGGGIGYELYVWMKKIEWGRASVAILGIVLVVSTMDFISARVRQRLV